MKKILRAIIVALLIFNITLIDATPILAKTAKTYYLDLDSLNVKVKQYLTSLMIDDETKAVYINNTYVGNATSDPQSFKFSSTNYNINLSISLSNLSVNATVSPLVTKKYKATFTIDIEENKYYVCTLNETGQKIQSSRNGDIHTFGTFTYEGKSFEVKLIQSTGQVYVNGDSQGTLPMTNFPIVFEYIKNDFPITNIDYMHGDLPQFTWLNADGTPNAYSQTKVFYNRNFNGISFSEEYTLSNEYLNLPSIILTYGDTVDEWHRVAGTSVSGTGVWEKTGRKIAVVCEYNENYEISKDCVNAIRNEFPRYWAVYATEATKTKSVDEETQNVKVKGARYKNYYNTGNWTEVDSWPSESSSRLVQKATSTAIWSDWTDWTDVLRPNGACSGGNCKAESAKFYRNRSYSWQDTTGWHLTNDCPTSSTQQGIYRTTQDEMCGVDYKECQHKDCGINQNDPYIYSNFGGWQTSVYGYQNGCAYRRGANSECGQTYVRQGCSHQVSYSNNCGKCGTGQNFCFFEEIYVFL